MQQNINDKFNTNNKFITFYNSNKKKIYLIVFMAFVAIIIAISFQTYEKKKNNLVADKFVKAGIYIVSDKKELALKLYEEIIYKKNKFYSNLALLNILENNLIEEKKKILELFEIVEKLGLSKEQKDNLIFKKSLYLIKNNNSQEAMVLLQNLIKENSSLKLLAEEVIKK